MPASPLLSAMAPTTERLRTQRLCTINSSDFFGETMHLRKALRNGFLTILLCTGALAAPILDLIPSIGTIGGMPGDIVGWGFTLTNTTDFLVVTGADFVPPSPLGVFNDFIGPNFIVVGPA